MCVHMAYQNIQYTMQCVSESFFELLSFFEQHPLHYHAGFSFSSVGGTISIKCLPTKGNGKVVSDGHH